MINPAHRYYPQRQFCLSRTMHANATVVTRSSSGFIPLPLILHLLSVFATPNLSLIISLFVENQKKKLHNIRTYREDIWFTKPKTQNPYNLTNRYKYLRFFNTLLYSNQFPVVYDQHLECLTLAFSSLPPFVPFTWCPTPYTPQIVSFPVRSPLINTLLSSVTLSSFKFVPPHFLRLTTPFYLLSCHPASFHLLSSPANLSFPCLTSLHPKMPIFITPSAPPIVSTYTSMR